MIKNYAYVCCFLSLISCAPAFLSKTVDTYAQKKIIGKRLAIAPFNNTPFIEYSGSVKEEFGEGDKEELILKHFKEALVTNIRDLSTFSEVRFDTFTATPKLDTSKFDMGDIYKVKIALPADTNTIRFTVIEADFILFFQDLTLGTFHTGTPGMTGMWVGGGFGQAPMYVGGSVGTSKKNLGYEGTFAIWDNVNHTVVTYGRIKSTVEAESYVFVDIIRMEHWDRIDRDFASDLLKGSPFAR